MAAPTTPPHSRAERAAPVAPGRWPPRDRARAARPEDGLRPLQGVGSFKVKLGLLVAVSVTLAAALAWVGVRAGLNPFVTIPAIVLVALVVTQILARGMTSPLREMTRAAQAMARGDYSQRIRTSSRDEVGQLAAAFTSMAHDLEQTDTMRRDLVANVSHELRTPVAALRGQLENLVDGVTPPDETSLGVALAATERLSGLVDHLLDLSRLEAGVTELERERIELTPFLHEAVDEATLGARARGRDVRWSIDVRPADLAVSADPERIRQVISNLLDNASRHSPAGGRIRLSAGPLGPGTGADVGRSEEPAGATPAGVWIDVRDEGPGIAPEDRERVFERFRRGGGADVSGGTGLGLAIARWAVALHGGTIEVLDDDLPAHRDSGRSSVIRVTLPADPEPGTGTNG